MNRRIITITIALVLALVGGGLVILYARGADARAMAAQSPAPVWVSQQIVPAGTTLQDAQRNGLIVQTSVSSKGVPVGALQQITAANGSLVATSDIAAGEYVLAARFGAVPLGTRAIEVPSGMLAISLNLSDAARVGKFVTPGSHIALYQTYDLDDVQSTPPGKNASADEVHATSLLLPDVLVIAMGDAALSGAAARPAAEGEAATAAGESGNYLVTVAVKPSDAPALILGSSNERQLYGALRGPGVTLDPRLEVTDGQLRKGVTKP